MAAACFNASLGIFTFMIIFLVTPSTGEEYPLKSDRMGRIAGVSYVNLRSGPGISYPPITILNKGEVVKVEMLDGRWYRVSVPHRGSGYIYAEFLQLINGEEIEIAQSPPGQQTTKISGKEALKERAQEPIQLSTTKTPVNDLDQVPVVEPNGREQTPALRPKEIKGFLHPSLDRGKPTGNPLRFNGSLEGSIGIILLWILVPFCIFVLGWICGGNYYRRLDRIERTRLRF